MSLSDEISEQISGKTGQFVQNAMEYAINPAAQKLFSGGGKIVRGAGKTGKYAFKGICLIIKGGAFTTENIMKKTAEIITGNIKFSSKNLHMDELKKSGKVTMVEEQVTADVMKYFNKYCKQFGVHYTAMENKKDKNHPTYFLFFNNKDSDTILKVMKLSYKDYSKEAEKKADKNLTDNKRESVKAKLAFFRDRVAARDEEQRDVEKHLSKGEISK